MPVGPLQKLPVNRRSGRSGAELKPHLTVSKQPFQELLPSRRPSGPLRHRGDEGSNEYGRG
jgi:hypothetical protein